MTIVIIAFAVWISAIMFGPWAIVKYAENQFGDRISLHNVVVTPQLDAKINRIDFKDDKLRFLSIRGIEIRWSLLSDPKLIVEASGANHDDQFSLSNFSAVVTKSNSDTNFPLEIHANAEKLMLLGSSDISEIETKFLSDRDLSEFRHFKAMSGNINLRTPFALVAESGVLEVDETRVVAGNYKIVDKFFFTLHDVASKNIAGTADRILGAITLDSEDIDFSITAYKPQTNDSVFSADQAAIVGTYDAHARKMAGEATLAIENGKFMNFRFLHSIIKTSREGDDIDVLAEGIIEPNSLELEERYIGNLPATRYQISLDANSSSVLSNAEFQLQSKPSIDIKVTGFSNVGVSNLIDECIFSECDLGRIGLEYLIETDGTQMSGVSDCADLSCPAELSNHKLITSDTNKFFASIQRSGVISPLILGAAYAQMLGGEVNGNGHNLRF